MASAGKAPEVKKSDGAAKNQITDSIGRLSGWLEELAWEYSAPHLLAAYRRTFSKGVS
jgi:hypothetical protein